MKLYLLPLLIPTALFCSVDYQQIAVDTLKIAHDLMDLPPKNGVRIRAHHKEVIITPDNKSLAIKPLDRNKNLPMHWVAENGTLHDLSMLINFGASVTTPNDWDQTPLMKAVEGGSPQNVGYLFSNGARLTQERHPMTSFNPFHYAVKAAKEGSTYRKNKDDAMVAIINILSNHDLSHQYINMASKQGTPLELALKNNQSPKIIKALLNNGAEITKQAYQIGYRNPAIAHLFKDYGKLHGLNMNEQPAPQ